MSEVLIAGPMPAPLALPRPDEAHVWIAFMDTDATARDRLVRILSSDERERAARFHLERDARRWMMARATLRAILGAYLERKPATLTFTYEAKGKPGLVAQAGRPDLQFSVSHSAELAVFAFAVEAPVGVDIERLRVMEHMQEVAARTFSLRECRALGGLRPGLRAAGFFNCWTRKEAYIKALGEGLSYPLKRFSVSLAPGLPARLETVEDAPDHVEGWTMEALRLPEGFAGAVVVARPGMRVRCAPWRELP